MDPLRPRPSYKTDDDGYIEYRHCDHEGCENPGMSLAAHQIHQKITTPYHALAHKPGNEVGTHPCKMHVAKEVNAASYADLKRSGILGMVLKKKDELMSSGNFRIESGDDDDHRVPDGVPKDWGKGTT